LDPIFFRPVHNVCLDKISADKTFGSNLTKKSCILSRGYTFDSIVLKLGQNVYLGEISVHFQHGRVRSKRESLVTLTKILFVLILIGLTFLQLC